MKNSKITQDEIEIIKRAQAGDELAFNQLFYKYKSFVDNLLYKYIQDMDEAKDITNIVFLKVHDKLSMFTDYESFGGWLRILTKNVAIDYLRTIKNKVSIDINDYKLQANTHIDSIETKLINKITNDKIVKLFNDLPIRAKKICKMYYLDDLSVSEISDSLHVPIGTVKCNLFRSRNLIKNKLKLCS